MKFLSLIFICYLLVLSVVPCCTADICEDEQEYVGSTQSHQEKDDCSNCSPFALCGTCAGFTLLAQGIQADPAELVNPTGFSPLILTYNYPYIPFCFQPPQTV